MKNEILCAEKLSKDYNGKTVLKSVSLQVRRGQSIAVTGKSGAGKTTLLSILGGLERPSGGSVFLCGKKMCARNVRVLRRDYLGFVFQNSCLIEEFTVYENVASAIRLSDSDADASEYLSMVGLADKAGDYPSTLSGGEARRVSLARALAKKPAILLLDEPTEGLDRETAEEMMRLILSLCEREGTAVLMVTHQEEFAAMMEREYRLEGGLLLEKGAKT